MNFPFTKVLEVPVILHKNIKDEDLLLFSNSYAQTHMYIVDRNDLNHYINNNPHVYAQYIDFSKIQSTAIRENFYFGCETISYKYLDDNIGDCVDYPLFRNETLSVVRSTNTVFINHNHLKYKIIIKLCKKDNIYTICYYYNNRFLDQFFNARRKDYLLVYLLEKAEKQNIITKSNNLLNKILEGNLELNDKKCNINTDEIYSNSIFKNIELYNYQKKDICWFKNIENDICKKNNVIVYDSNYYYPILGDNYLMTSNSRNIIPNINKLQYNLGGNNSEDGDNDNNNNLLMRSFINTSVIQYFGGNIISDLGLGKTLIVLYAILSEFFDKETEPINRNFYNFIEFSKHCNYFYKMGSKKGKCCEKEIVCNELFCNEHKNSIFIDKKKIILKNLEYFNISNYITIDDHMHLLRTKSTLIICPSHLCNQWVNEYYTRCNDKVKSKTHVLLITTYNQYANLTVSDILFSDIVIISYSFLVNSKYTNITKNYNNSFYHPDFINTSEFPLDIFSWHRIVFEEFHELRNMSNYNNIKRVCKSLKSTFKWNISGTPFANGINGFLDSLELNTNIKIPNFESNRYAHLNNHFDINDLMDIHSIGLNSQCNLIRKASFLFRRNTKESVKDEYKSNIVIDHLKLLDFTDEERSIYDSHLNGFNNKYSKFLIQLCCHPELYSETKHLLQNCKTLSEIRNALLNHNKKNLNYYKQKIEVLEDEIHTLEEDDDTEANVMRLSVLRRNLTNDKKMFINLEKTYNYLQNTIDTITEPESCPICLEDINNIAITSCGHKFCWECIDNYAKTLTIKKCPCCKTEFTPKDIYLLKKTDENEYKNDNELQQIINDTKSTKIGNIIYWLKQQFNNNNEDGTSSSTSSTSSTTSKIIVFSQWDEILNKVSEYLEKYKINVVHCKGSVYQKKKSIDLFINSEKYNIIMLSSRNAASGINLTVANKIVFIEPVYGNNEYRTNIENQAIGRCARIGNKQTINVTRFIINNTIESDIYYNTIDDSKIKILPQN
jgi:SNF2 family DNA or RNA helicase